MYVNGEARCTHTSKRNLFDLLFIHKMDILRKNLIKMIEYICCMWAFIFMKEQGYSKIYSF